MTDTIVDVWDLAYRFFNGQDEAAYAATLVAADLGLDNLASRTTAVEAASAANTLDSSVNKSAATGAAPDTGAQTFNLAAARIFYRIKGDNGQTWTFTNPVAGARFWLFIEQDDVGTRLKPTLAGYTFHTNGTGGTGGALPTLSTTAGLVDVFEFVAVDATNAHLVNFSLGLDEA